MMGGSDDIHSELMSKWRLADVDETCRELGRAGLLDNFYAGDKVYFVQLSDNGIIYMENRFVDGLTSVLDYMGKIKTAIPFL